MPLRRVIKVGGSLLEWPPLGPTLHAWLATYSADENVLLPGGGPAADWVRQAQAVHGFSDHAAHWLAIRAMQLGAGLLTELLPQAIACNDPAELKMPARGGRIVIFDPLGWLEEEEGAENKNSPQRHRGTEKTREEKVSEEDPGGGFLPASWDVTSDSIAAHLATAIGADELVLLKSALPQASSIAAAAAEGYVDRWLPHCWRRTIRCVDLRTAGWTEARLESEK